jgi:hypothetical protein
MFSFRACRDERAAGRASAGEGRRKLPGDAHPHRHGFPWRVNRPRCARLHKELVRILTEPQAAQRFASEGAEPASTIPAELGWFMGDEHERWKQVIKSPRIKVV